LKGQAVQLPQTCLRGRIIAEVKATNLGGGKLVLTFVEENGLTAGIVYEVHIKEVEPG